MGTYEQGPFQTHFTRVPRGKKAPWPALTDSFCGASPSSPTRRDSAGLHSSRVHVAPESVNKNKVAHASSSRRGSSVLPHLPVRRTTLPPGDSPTLGDAANNMENDVMESSNTRAEEYGPILSRHVSGAPIYLQVC